MKGEDGPEEQLLEEKTEETQQIPAVDVTAGEASGRGGGEAKRSLQEVSGPLWVLLPTMSANWYQAVCFPGKLKAKAQRRLMTNSGFQQQNQFILICVEPMRPAEPGHPCGTPPPPPGW